MDARVAKREWLEEWLHGLEKSSFTGRIDITIDMNKGGITRLIPMRQEDMN